MTHVLLWSCLLLLTHLNMTKKGMPYIHLEEILQPRNPLQSFMCSACWPSNLYWILWMSLPFPQCQYIILWFFPVFLLKHCNSMFFLGLWLFLQAVVSSPKIFLSVIWLKGHTEELLMFLWSCLEGKYYIKSMHQESSIKNLLNFGINYFFISNIIMVP